MAGDVGDVVDGQVDCKHQCHWKLLLCCSWEGNLHFPEKIQKENTQVFSN